MSALFFLLRWRVGQSWFDRIIGNFFLRWSYRAIQDDGCIADVTGGSSSSLQYHAYSGALMARTWRHFGGERLREIVVEAALYLCEFVDPEGDFNYKGRGQRQSFGYAAAVYLLREAIELSPKYASRFSNALAAVYEFILRHWQPRCGHLPLVLNSFQPSRRVGWYHYNHLTVYNAFCGVWLALAADVGDWPDNKGSTRRLRTSPVHVFKSSSAVVVRTPTYFCCVSAGHSGYPAETGLAPAHLWVRELGPIVSCPGWAVSETSGDPCSNEAHGLNQMAPLSVINETYHGPACGTGTLRMHGDGVAVEMSYGGIQVLRIIDFSPDAIRFEDQVSLQGESLPIGLVPLNIPLVVERLEIGIDQALCRVYLKPIERPDTRVLIKYRCSLGCRAVRVLDPKPLIPGLVRVVSAEPLSISAPVVVRITQEWLVLD
jgi:hypothetical protein